MSELTDRLKRMLSQAQMFAIDAPMEALARAKLLVSQANAALSVVSDVERDDVLSILQLARKRVARYEARVSSFQHDNRERAALFTRHEFERLQQPIPTKV
jgi:hypothetical protein